MLLGTMWYAESVQWQHRPGRMQSREIEKGARLLDRVPASSVGSLTEDLTGVPVFDIGRSESVPVILLHGTPGSSWGFDALAPAIASRDRRVVWFDLPGFAAMGGERSSRFEDLSASTYAEYTLAVMNRLGLDRAHIVGWSNGGAVALRLADGSPERVASITLLGAVGAQETEGSGSWFFEHGKYKVGRVLLEWGARVVPPFGYIPLDERISFMRNFDDTDQRPLAGIMARLDTPTLILHGRDDFLVADWAAEHHHDLMPRSTLIMTEHDHFMPFRAADDAAEHIVRFIERFDDPGAQPSRRTVDLAPRVLPFGEAGDAALGWLHVAPWWLLVPMVAAVGWIVPGRAWVAVLVGATELDIGVAWLGLALGKGARTVRNRNTVRPMGWIAVLVEPLAQLGLGFLFVQLVARPAIRLSPDRLHGLGWVIAVLVLAALFVVLPKIWTTRGRQRLRASLTRVLHHEWWPAWALYAPLTPLFAWLSIKHRHPLAFTACNPGIPNGGGLAGESKADITRSLVETLHECVLYGEACEPGGAPRARADALADRVEREPRLGGWPVMLKPDAGEQGRGVTRCGSPDDAARFFAVHTGRAMAQRYHPGPHEVGVFYVREPRAGSGLPGRVLAVNRKRLPVVIGDGRRTIEDLIWRHPRHRCQAELFVRKLGEERRRVPPEGEAVTLSRMGNHAQGCAFLDAPDLITPELESAVCAVAEAFSGGLDIGRFDLRYADESALRAGRGFGVVEVNGVTSESANLYDPGKSPLFAWRILAGQWSAAYRLGAARIRGGSAPLSLRAAAGLTRAHLRDRAPA